MSQEPSVHISRLRHSWPPSFSSSFLFSIQGFQKPRWCYFYLSPININTPMKYYYWVTCVWGKMCSITQQTWMQPTKNLLFTIIFCCSYFSKLQDHSLPREKSAEKKGVTFQQTYMAQDLTNQNQVVSRVWHTESFPGFYGSQHCWLVAVILTDE